MRAAGALLALALLAPGTAHAEPRDEAKRLFLAGLENAREGRYEVALEQFLEAQDIYPHPATVYNIARAYYDMGQLEESLGWFELYQASAPDKADEVAPLIASVNAMLSQQEAASAPTTAAEGAATSDELQRLQAIADELTALSQAIAERGVAETDPIPEREAVEAPAVEALPEPADFLSDAYEKTVVTASRYGQDPLDSPSTLSVLTEQDIRLSGATNIADLLRRVAGVDVMQLSSAQPDVSIRGFNRELSNKVLVLIDGRTMYTDFLGNPLWETFPIGLGDIERIEIIRGPGSAVYGANAMTGVINIITRRPGEGQNEVSFSAGHPGYAAAYTRMAGRADDLSWRASAGLHQAGRWSQEAWPTDDGSVGSPVDDQDQGLDVVRSSLRLDRRFLDKGFASVDVGYAGGMLEFYAIGTLGDYVFEFDQWHARGDLAYGPVHVRSWYTSLASTAQPWYQDAGSRGADVLPTTVDADIFDVELEAPVEFETGSVEHRFNAGVGLRSKLVDWTYLREQPLQELHTSAFVQEEARLHPVSLVGSLRIDKHPLVPLEETLSPRAAAIVRVLDETSARVTAGTAFRNPTFMENYTSLKQPTTREGVYVDTLGSESLVPERVATLEAGLHDNSTNFHEADLAVYRNVVTDLIFLDPVDPDGGATDFDPDGGGFTAGSTSCANQDEVYVARGLEAEVKAYPVRGLDLYANLALEDIEIRAYDVPAETDASTSRVKVNAGLMYRSAFRTDLSAHLHYASAQTWQLREFDAAGQIDLVEGEVPARTITSARLAVRPLEDESLELAFSGWNLAGLLGAEGFREHHKGQVVGYRAFGSATYRFGGAE